MRLGQWRERRKQAKANASANGERGGEEAAPASWKLLRWIVAAGLVVGAAGLLIASHYADSLRSCETKEVAGKLAEETCAAFPLIDLAPVFLLALALLWPELAEFEIAGLVRVVRRIDQRQADLERGQERIERQLLQVQIVSQTQQVQVNLHERLDAAANQTKAEHREITVPAEDDENLWAEFAREWQALEPWSDLAARLQDPKFAKPVQATLDQGRAPAEAAGLQPADQVLLERVALGDRVSFESLAAWALEARERLELVRQARALGPAAPARILTSATLVARGLLKEIDDAGLRQP